MKQKIEFASHAANLCLVRNFVRQFVADMGFGDRDTDLLVLGVDEACTNVIRHVYKHEETHLMALSCERLEIGVRFRLRDYGKRATDGAPKPTRTLEKVRPGGLGLHLINSAFDHVEYVLKKQGTELVLTKNLPARVNADAGAGTLADG